jgi:hypothetical protein
MRHGRNRPSIVVFAVKLGLYIDFGAFSQIRKTACIQRADGNLAKTVVGIVG